MSHSSSLSYITGIIIPYAGSSLPTGWLWCDGTAYSRTDEKYSSLYTVLGTKFGAPNGSTFNVPDMRGLFPRGRDGGRGIDPERTTRGCICTGSCCGDNVGSCQASEFECHAHCAVADTRNDWKYTSGTGANWSDLSSCDFWICTKCNGPDNFGSETRPKNVALNFIIKL